MESSQNKKKELEDQLFDIEGVVNFHPDKYIEVQPKIFSPLLINIKATLIDFDIRSEIVKRIVEKVDPDSVCICGIESGGSYYASAVSDKTKKPLILFRKKPKEYGTHGSFVGSLPSIKGGLITIVDDVLAGGTISTRVVNILKKYGYNAELIVIFNYQPNFKKPLSEIEIKSLTKIDSFLKVGYDKGVFTKKDINLIKKEINKFRL